MTAHRTLEGLAAEDRLCGMSKTTAAERNDLRGLIQQRAGRKAGVARQDRQEPWREGGQER